MVKRQIHIIGLILAAAIMMLAGCTKYVVTHGLGQPLVSRQSIYIGEMHDGLPTDTDPGDKPTLEAINQMRTCLANEIAKKDLFGSAELYDSSMAVYKVTGVILGYRKGNGFLRFLFGVAGNAEITAQLELRNTETDHIIFSGNFRGIVDDWMESGDKMFQNVSKEFVKAVAKQNEAALKAKGAQSADISR